MDISFSKPPDFLPEKMNDETNFAKRGLKHSNLEGLNCMDGNFDKRYHSGVFCTLKAQASANHFSSLFSDFECEIIMNGE